MTNSNGPLRVGIGGPVGSGKTALTDALCKTMRDTYDVAAITNDIYTREDADFLTSSGALVPERIIGVETGGCPLTAIREDASMNLAAVDDMISRFPKLELIFIESGDQTYRPELPIFKISQHCSQVVLFEEKTGLFSKSKELLVFRLM